VEKQLRKVDCSLLKRQYTSLGNKLAIGRKRYASAVITQGAVKTPLPTYKVRRILIKRET
jgi:hypothetical protein